MKSHFKILLSILVVALAVSDPVVAQKKRGQTSMKFLSISTSARASGMANAQTAIDNNGSYSVFYNPAGLAQIDGSLSLSGSNLEWIAGINYVSTSLAYKLNNPKLGVFAFNLLSVDYGDFQGTIFDRNSGLDYIETGNFTVQSISVGLAYANAITEKFSVGANFKYAFQDLGDLIDARDGDGNTTTRSIAAGKGVLDFGVLYKTGFESLNFAMALRNFSTEVSFDDEESELPLTFKIGLAMDVLDLAESIDKNTHSLIVAVDANRPRDFDEQLFIGTEYTFLKRFSLRGGYTIPKEEEGVSFGIGVIQPLKKFSFKADYSYTDFGVWGGINRISLQIDF